MGASNAGVEGINRDRRQLAGYRSMMCCTCEQQQRQSAVACTTTTKTGEQNSERSGKSEAELALNVL